MKKFLTMGIASLLTLSMMAGCTSAAAVSDRPSSVKFDFEKDDAGFTPIYADYHTVRAWRNFTNSGTSTVKFPLMVRGTASSSPATTTATTCSWGM